ncbi:MAG TPA: tetratricopeptide repeat protein [Planctomycetaceae bacterium]|nr:tetratricopeptide repeat protein [Planctomycetaceae bacterium]
MACLVALAGSSGCVSGLLTSVSAAKAPVGETAQVSRSESSDTLPPKQAAEACFATARELQAHGHAPEAIILYERARQLNPQEPQVSRFLAVLYDQQGNDARATTEYRKALELAPHDADLLNDFGYYFYRRRDWRHAEEQFRKAIAQTSEHERAWVNLGLALGEQERFQESFEAFSKVLGPAAAHSNVGVILAAHQRKSEAEGAFKQALAIQNDLPQPRAFLAHFEQPANTR